MIQKKNEIEYRGYVCMRYFFYFAVQLNIAFLKVVHVDFDVTLKGRIWS